MSINTTQRYLSGMPALIPLLALLILLFAGCTDQEATAPEQSSSPQLAAPEPQQNVAAPEAVAESPADAEVASIDGQRIYQASCRACHAAGIAGAPKQGDKAAWAPRIAKGNDALLASVKNGLNAMPPKGGCMSCTDAELQAAIAYLVEQGS